MTTKTRTAPRKGKTKASERRDHLIHAVHHTAHMLSEQGPMNITFVHNNTLLGLQKHHFHKAIAISQQAIGVAAYQPDGHFLAAFAAGRIIDSDLDDSLAMQPDLDPGAELATIGGRILTRGEVIKAVLRSDAAHRKPLAALQNAFDPETGRLDLGPETERLCADLAQQAQAILEDMRAAVGVERTLAEWLGAHFGLPLVRVIADTCAGNDLRAGASRRQDALTAMGIPADRHAAYLRRATELWGEAAREALGIEARLVDVIAERLIFRRGDLGSIAAGLAAEPAGAALRALRTALCADLGVAEPLGPLDPHTLAERSCAPVGPATTRPLSAEERDVLGALLDLTGEETPTEIAADLHAALSTGLMPDALAAPLRDLAGALKDKALQRAVRNMAAYDARTAFDSACAEVASDLTGALAAGQNLSDVMLEITGIDVTAKINTAMIRHLSAFTDEGLAALRMPDRQKGLFTAWRQAAPSDPLLRFEGGGGWQDALASLPADPAEALIALLDEMGIPDAHWEAYLGRCLAQLKGWAGMMFWMETHPGHYKQKMQPADTIQYLAMRLFTERAVLARIMEEVCGISPHLADLDDWAQRNAPEVMLRKALHRGALSPDLAEAASLVLSMRPPTTAERTRIAHLARAHWQRHTADAAREAAAQDLARVMRVAAQLGLTARDIAQTPGIAKILLSEIEALTPQHISRIWLEAFEAHYRDEVLNALAQNKGRGRWIDGRKTRPKAQLVLCIDEREENIHRYFGELDPEYETLGAAGFFGVAIAHSGLGDHSVTPLCPAVATPAHRMAEVPRDEALQTVWPVAQRRAGLADAFGAVMWETKRNPLVAFLTTQITGLFHAVPLVGRIFAPLGFHRIAESITKHAIPEVPTRLTHTRIEGAALERFGLHGADLPYGFDTAEGADRVEAQLRNWGLTCHFAPIVVTCSHRSFSVNNPHENAHDCGACSGKPGGVNARLFAALANDSGVREVLRDRGIDIPDDTWFVGAEHNTCTEDFLCFDTQDIPAPLRDAWALVQRDLDETSRRAARERCRRFRSAPKDASPAQSWDHVRGRSQDLSQVRPEWGHATNAFAVVGRRALTQGLFFDRRGFVISYDPTQDADGTILERILLAVGPVGAGINLEYYFSTVNPDGHGSGTKVPHNVVGMIGVMPGAQGDLATGLPRQMTEVHEAMRLQLIVDAPLAVLGEIYGRQPGIQELLDGQWVHLIAHDPETCSFHRFVPGVGFARWDKPLTPLPEVSDSYAWIRGKHDCFLPPARIHEPKARWDAAST